MTQTMTLDPSRIDLLRNLSFDDEGPCIYALMVTGKDLRRALLARAAVISFLAQGYGNRRLVVVNDGDYDFDLPGVPEDRVVQLRLRRKQVLGELRNLALDEVPEGAIWVLWDDDDWHHPALLADQYRVLREQAVHTCFLSYQVKYAFGLDAGWIDYEAGGFAATLMSHKTAELRFPADRRGEDSVYCHDLKKSYEWYAWENPPHGFIRFYHGYNTWGADHFRLAKHPPGERHMPEECARHLEEVLPYYEGVS